VGRSHAGWVFAVEAPLCALLYWWFADWWAYVDDPNGPWPKFIMPWWWQVIESAIVGSLAAGFLTGVWWLVWRAFHTQPDVELDSFG
jgi:hypothetical protein